MRSVVAGFVVTFFALVSPVSSLFDPNDVAVGPLESTERGQGPPDRRELVRPGSCDQPGSGCAAMLPKRTEVVVPPIDPGVRPPRALR